SRWAMLQNRSGPPTGALLLAGPPGVGKRAFARALAQGILCADPRAGAEACGACTSCRLFAGDAHPDFRVLEPEMDEGRAELSDGSPGAAVSPARDRSILVGQVRA